MQEIQIGLIGFGTVGSGLAQVLYEQQTRLEKRVGATIRLSKVADIMVESLPDHIAHDGKVVLTKDANDIFIDPEIHIVVELIGGIEPAKSFILKAIEHGKHVVTANKALLSLHGKEIFEAAARMGKEGLVGNRILSIMGIMNGTANYILTQMTDHATPFEDVLKDAQEKGFAEADPTYDIEGIDTAHKLVILMTIAYGTYIHLDQVTTEGISRIQPIDIDFAREFGYRIKLLAISRNHRDHVEARVHPTMVPEEHLLANINGAYNAIHFKGDMVGNVVLYGLGAGMMPTGSAVVADVVDIARDILTDAVQRVPSLSYLPEHFKARKITPLEDLRCPYYFRMTALDKPGVLSTISGILGNHGISIESVIQKGRGHREAVPLVILTHEAAEAAVKQAVAEIDALDIVTDKTVKIRILTNNGEEE
jgi:homoserine dehydrogenase